MGEIDHLLNRPDLPGLTVVQDGLDQASAYFYGGFGQAKLRPDGLAWDVIAISGKGGSDGRVVMVSGKSTIGPLKLGPELTKGLEGAFAKAVDEMMVNLTRE